MDLSLHFTLYLHETVQYLISYKNWSSVFFNLSHFLLNSCCQVLWFVSFKGVATCVVTYWPVDIATAKRISKRNVVILADLPHIPCRMPVQCSSACHSLFAVWFVICRPAHGPPLLPFVRSANICRSEHIHRMLLSDVAVTTEQHQENIWVWFWRRAFY